MTGATGGIGRTSALRLACEGYGVVVAWASNKAGADAVVEEVQLFGGRGLGVQADVADELAVAGLFDRAEAEFGGVDVLVHTAGIMCPPGDWDLADLDLAVLDRLLHTNLRGTFVVNQQAARRLRPGGAIVNFSSSITRSADPGSTAYAATKGGVEAITRILARELCGSDITVNAVAPGPMASTAFFTGAPGQGRSPLQRLGQPTDIAEIVAFLAGPGHWINGQVVHANGGAN